MLEVLYPMSRYVVFIAVLFVLVALDTELRYSVTALPSRVATTCVQTLVETVAVVAAAKVPMYS